MSINTIHFCAILEPINWFVNLFSNFGHFGVLFYFSSLVVLLPLIYFMSGRGKKAWDFAVQAATVLGGVASGVSAYQGSQKAGGLKPNTVPNNPAPNNPAPEASTKPSAKQVKSWSVLSLVGVNLENLAESNLALFAYAILSFFIVILWTIFNISASTLTIYLISKYNNIDTINEKLGSNLKWLTPYWREKLIKIINYYKIVSSTYIVIQLIMFLIATLCLLTTCFAIVYGA